MSPQLTIASGFSIFAIAALALLAPPKMDLPASSTKTGATIEIAAPASGAPLLGRIF